MTRVALSEANGNPQAVALSERVHWKSEVSVNEKTLLIFYISSYGNTRRMAEAIYEGAMGVENVRVSLYDLEGSEISPFVDLIESADGLVFGTPTINGDAVKPVWDLLSSLAVVSLKGNTAACSALTVGRARA